MSSQGRSSQYVSESVPEVRSHSNDDLPQVSHVGAPFSAQHPYEDYEFYEQPPPAAPEYQQHSASPHLSSQQSPRFLAGSDGTRSPPPVGEGIETSPDPNRTSRPLSPSSTYRQSEVGSAGLESVNEKEGQKEVYQSVYPVGVVPYQQPQYASASERKHRRICGMAMKWCLVLTALILVAIIAVAVALGVVFGTKHSKPAPPPPPPTNTTVPPPVPTSTPTPSPTGNPEYTIGGAYGPEFFSTTGAFNGSGIAIASADFYGSALYVYYQHYTGEIRSILQNQDGSWSDSSVVVPAGNAKNGTPISAVAYIDNTTAQWHLFYINQEGNVNQRTSSNSSQFQVNIWQDGPLNLLNLKALDADSVGLQACYWGDYYGDANYNFGEGFAPTNSTLERTGMNLWYADSATSFQQYGWLDGQVQWTPTDYDWSNQNGHAGVGCYSWATGSTTYVFMVDLTNTLQVYWKDDNSSMNTATHQTNQWNPIPEVAISGVHPSTSMGFTNYLVCQLQDESIHGYNLTWQAENTTFAPVFGGESGTYDEFSISTGSQDLYAVPGTHLSNTAVPGKSGGASLLVFLQTVGNDITFFSRDDSNAGGIWTSAEVPVNQ